MKTKLLHLLFLFLLYVPMVCCKSHVPVGYRVSLAVPSDYSAGFIGRAYLMETDRDRHQERPATPGFRVSLSVESVIGNYSCALELFLGNVKVWSSGHYSRFVVSEECVLELTVEGDLRLKGHNNQIGWRTGTDAQSVERLQLLKNGNLVLLDALNIIKWQSFHFPTDVMLWGQRLDVATRLTSYPTNSKTTTAFHYSFEIQPNKLALYLNSNTSKYSYWEFTPSNNLTINFIQLGSSGIELYNENYRKIAQISSSLHHPPRFLALNNRTGNLGLFHYFPVKAQFEATYQAVNETCDLPLACNPYGVCTFSNSCSCIRLSVSDRGCAESGDFCGIANNEVKMVELQGIGSVLRDGAKRANVSRLECSRSCIQNCKCVSAAFFQYSSTVNGSGEYDSQCYIYEFMAGIKEVGEGMSLMVKVSRSKSKPRKWILVVVGVVDVLILLLVGGGLIYYYVWKRKRSSDTNGR